MKATPRSGRSGPGGPIDTAGRVTHASDMVSRTTTSNRPKGRVTTRQPASRERLLAAARALFVERGYHATRPQDISRAAGLGHGTFYLHFADKQACFMAFVEEARAEIDAAILGKAAKAANLQGLVEAILLAIYDYAERHPGVLVSVLSNEAVIASAGSGNSILERWGEEWGERLKQQARQGLVARGYDYAVIGQAVVGAIHQASLISFERGRPKAALVRNLTRFITRALTPDD
jgi:AcrR family transcriptional regulator